MHYKEYSIAGTVFEVKYPRYHTLNPVGVGAFGMVAGATDACTGTRIAIKKILTPFASPVHAKRTYREFKLLRHMNHDNVISLRDLFMSPSGDVYLTTELLEGNLTHILNGAPLSEEHTRWFTHKILLALRYIHSSGIVHRDLKPSNCLINEDCDLKICDLGLARVADIEMTGYVVTRYYRAPEVMLMWQKYDQEIDIWSAGCILAEMMLGKPLFRGENRIDQFLKITEILGTPPESIMKNITEETTFNFVSKLPHTEPIPLSSIIPGAAPIAIDLLEKMLQYDYTKRPTAAQCLEHPYFKGLRTPPAPEAKKFDWSADPKDLSVSGWKEKIFADIEDFARTHPDPPIIPEFAPTDNSK